MIIAESGTHFDQQMVEAFLAAEQQFVAIRQRYADCDTAVSTETPAEAIHLGG